MYPSEDDDDDDDEHQLMHDVHSTMLNTFQM